MKAPEPDYSRVNGVLNDAIFCGTFANRPLYLDIENELLTEISARLGVDEQDAPERIAAAARSSLDLSLSDPFQRHDNWFRNWFQEDDDAQPPFTALLCTLSLAAERMHHDEEFSSTNYYERLFELLSISDEENKKRIKKNFKATRKYWEALNKWLRSHDGALGYPTAAQVFNSWKYVSYPISQALVREADRDRLRTMFEDYHLMPGEALSLGEMKDYIANWVANGASGQWLKRLWSNLDLREKIADTAIQELTVWEGPKDNKGDRAHQKYVTLMGAFSGWPKKALRLVLGVSEAGLALGKKPVPSANELVSGTKASFASCEDRLTLSASGFEGFLAIDPAPEISLSAALSAGFCLELFADKIRITRRPKPIISLERNLDGVGFKEISRVKLLGEHIILCHEKWFPAVKGHVAQCCRQGFQEYPAGDLGGLPRDWGAFTNVEFVSAPESKVQENLELLTPLADASLVVDGGLHLINQDWHPRGGITITGAFSGSETSIELIKTDLLTGKDEVIAASKQAQVPVLSMPAGTEALSGDFEAQLKKGNTVVQRHAIHFFDAERPRKRLAIQVPDIAYAPALSNPMGTLSAAPADGAELAVSGARVNFTSFEFAPVAKLQASKCAETEGFERNSEDTGQYKLEKIDGLAEACAIRGHHMWICEPFREGDTPRTPKLMDCRDCGSRVLLKNRGTRKRSRQFISNAKQTAKQIPSGAQTGIPETSGERQTSDPEILFDALCYLGGGPGARLIKVGSAAGDEPWSGHEFIGNLAALGHIDVKTRGTSLVPEAWWSAPPVIAVTGHQAAVMCGFRNQSLIDEVDEIISACGGQLLEEAQDKAPKRILIEGPLAEAVRTDLCSLTDPFGRAVSISESVGKTIALAARPISEIVAALKPSHALDLKNAEFFDPFTGKWSRCESPNQPGAYRTAGLGRAYFFRDAEGVCRPAPYTLVKLMGARQHGVRIHAFDPSKSTFIAALGCPPPLLLERALVLCSGRVPDTSNGRLEYPEVPRCVAEIVLSRMYT